jgi:ubiquitin carboxyl-terminal hydrolase L3
MMAQVPMSQSSGYVKMLPPRRWSLILTQFKQTIGHACGLIALLHSVSNGSTKSFIEPNSILDNLLKEATPLKPIPRADVLYNSDPLEEAHMSVAFKGDSKAPSAAEPNGYHFISFVQGSNGHLYELEGGWNGPIDLGPLGEDEDVMSEKALDAGIRRYVKAADGNMEFSMIALSTQPSN